MIITRTLASAMLAAFGAAGAHPAAGLEGPTPNDATVISLTVVPRSGHADVVVGVNGPISFTHFALAEPNEIVVDLSGATLGLRADDAYDGISRDGITRIRYSQFTPTVVRVVVALDAPHDYAVTNDRGALHISIDGAADGFQPWAVGRPSDERAANASEPVAKVEPSVTWSWENAPIADVLAMFRPNVESAITRFMCGAVPDEPPSVALTVKLTVAPPAGTTRYVPR